MKKFYVVLTLVAVWLSVGLQGMEEEKFSSITVSIVNETNRHSMIYYAVVRINKNKQIIRVRTHNNLAWMLTDTFEIKDRNIADYTQLGYIDVLLVSYNDIFELFNDNIALRRTIAEVLSQHKGLYTTENIPGVNCSQTVKFTVTDKKNFRLFKKEDKESQEKKPEGAPAIKKDVTNLKCQSLFNTRRSIGKTVRQWKTKKFASEKIALPIVIGNKTIDFKNAQIHVIESGYNIVLGNGDRISITLEFPSNHGIYTSKDGDTLGLSSNEITGVLGRIPLNLQQDKK